MKFLHIAVLVILASAVLQASAAESVTRVEMPVPVEWAADAGPSRLTLADLATPIRPTMSVKKFIEQYGLPSRFLVAKPKLPSFGNMLIYELAGGHTATVHVSAPPSDRIGAIFVADRSGKQVRLIK